MTVTFDTLRAMRKLREGGAEEPLAEGIVEVVTDATSELLTREYFDERIGLEREYLDTRFGAERYYVDARFEGIRAELYRALAIQGGVILAGVGAIVAMVETLN